MRIIDHRLCKDDGTPVPFVSTPNLDMDGVLRPKYLVICTQDGNLEQAIAWLARREARASAHLVIGRDGSITQMVPFDRVAWHAGRSEWNGETDLNRLSIGIALVNPGKLRRSRSGWADESRRVFPDSEVVELVHKHEPAPSGWIRFPDVQVTAAREAAAAIVQAYGLTDVLGHDDVAVERKTDPGPAFPMDQFRAEVMERRAVVNAGLNVDAELSVAKHFTVTKGCNVRSGPGVSHSPVLGSPLHVGNTVRGLESQNGWKRVHVLGRVNGITSITGWVREEYLEEVTEADESDAPSRRGRTAKVDQPGIGTTDKASETSVDDPVDPVPAAERAAAEQLATRYGLAASTRTIVEHAIAFAAATPAHTVTSTFLLIVVGHSGWPSDRPAHAPDWLRGRLGAAFEVLRDSYFRRKGLNAAPVADKANASVVLSTGATLALETARKIAEQTTGRPAPHNRHLLAALLVDARGADGSDALRVLAAAGIDPVRLREAFFEFVAAGDDDVDAWARVLLGDLRESRRLSGFHADVGGGDDYLDVRPDVLALARLIAARTLTPPLSIGLFGEWGSGKTFFMRMLRDEVARLAREARETEAMQRDQPFYKRIVQVEFNAWHYSEGNLWASLVQHIFENLRLVDDRRKAASEELQEPLLRQLGVEKAAAAQARRERRRAAAERKLAAGEVKKAKEEFDRQARRLARMSGENFLLHLPVVEVVATVRPTLEALGLPAVAKNAMEARAALQEARALLTRGSTAVAPLLYGPDRASRWLGLGVALLAPPAAALCVAVLCALLGREGIAGVAGFSSGVAGLLATGTRWVRKQLAWLGGHMKTLEGAQRQLDERIARAQAKNAARVREAEEQLRLKEAHYLAAREKEEAARRRMAEARVQLRQATVTKLLRSFIEERANSSDYRRHLGVLALIRNDFERLSNLIEEENWRLSPAVPAEDLSRWPSPRFETLEDERTDEAKRINRIVLYIDDLDRCPPAKVVEVLQAVHLLLAFPLFVVVVGVDARWITRSLETRYRQLLSVDGGAHDQAEAMDEFQELFGTATSHDYLEKIFQVPFWLKPMSDDACRHMVTGLLQASVVPDPPSDEAGEVIGDAEARYDYVRSNVLLEQAKAKETDTPRTESSVGGADADEISRAEHTGESATEKESEERKDWEEPPPLPEEELAPESLEIREAELRFMETLAPLLGRSPRALKRFVNVYRLIKARLTPSEWRVFLQPRAGLADYRAVLFLLAVDTGAPMVARALFAALREVAPAGDLANPTPAELLAALERDYDVARAAEWARVRPWLASPGGVFRPGDAKRLARWAARVSPFSFHSSRADTAPRPASRASLFTVTAGSTRVRRDPDAAEPVPGSPLPRGTLVQALEERGGWKRVVVQGEVNGVTGITGWVNARYLQPAIPALKIVGAAPAAAEM